MILNTQLSQDAEYIGDVKENRVGIDKNNIDFITTLLTSNLYSKPLESFLRETIANAYDSHIEAGTQEPILLLIERLDGWKKYRISIRDYGIGVSPERFDSIYRNVGSSTKRESNDYIGMFGIGRFSCLSCADVANITSFHNGIKYSYIMYKNGGGINIDKISEVKGDFKNGLEVSIQMEIWNETELTKAISKVCLFDKLHVVAKNAGSIVQGFVQRFNERTTQKYNTFCTNSILGYYEPWKNYFKVGNVLYDSPNDNVESQGIIIDLPMGSVDITPNREALQFTDFTNNTITKRVQEVKDELNTIFNDCYKGDMPITKFVKCFIYDGDIDVETSQGKLRVRSEDLTISTSKITIGGEQIPLCYVTFLKEIKWWGIPKEFIYKSICINPHRRNFDKTWNALFNERFVLADKKDSTTKQVTMKYFVDNLTKNVVILNYDSLNKFKTELVDAYPIGSLSKETVKKLIDFTFRHLDILELSNDSVPQSFIDDYRDEQKDKRKKPIVDNSVIPIRVYTTDSDSTYVTSTLKLLCSKGLVIYTKNTKDESTISMLRAISEVLSRHPAISAVISLKAEHIPMLENNKRFINLDCFLALKHKLLVKLVTCNLIKRKFLELDPTVGRVNIWDTPIYSEFCTKYKNENLSLKYIEHNEFVNEITTYYEKKGWLNKYDIKYFSLNEDEIKSLEDWSIMKAAKQRIIQSIAFFKFGSVPKIGLDVPKIPKIIRGITIPESKQTLKDGNIQKKELPSD